jgi:hypothetical protein
MEAKRLLDKVPYSAGVNEVTRCTPTGPRLKKTLGPLDDAQDSTEAGIWKESLGT